MAKNLYLHIKWDETREKNNARAGDDGIYDVAIKEGDEVKLICHLKRANVKKLTEDEVTLDIPDKGEYILRLGETTTVRYSDGHQVAGDWVDERLTYEIKLSDMSLDEYEASLPEFDIEDGVLVKARYRAEVAVVPEGVVKIGHNAFSSIGIKEVRLPSTLKEIGSFAFSNCRHLKHVELPQGVEEIGFYAFAGAAIEELKLPKGIKEIDNAAFDGTPFLNRLKSERFAILADRFLYLYNGYEDTVEVPPGVEVICSYAFSSREPEESYYFRTPRVIVLPNSVKRIKSSAFKYLHGLEEINLRADMDIDRGAFYDSSYAEKFNDFLDSVGKSK